LRFGIGIQCRCAFDKAIDLGNLCTQSRYIDNVFVRGLGIVCQFWLIQILVFQVFVFNQLGDEFRIFRQTIQLALQAFADGLQCSQNRVGTGSQQFAQNQAGEVALPLGQGEGMLALQEGGNDFV